MEYERMVLDLVIMPAEFLSSPLRHSESTKSCFCGLHGLEGLRVMCLEKKARMLFIEVLFAYEDEAVLAVQHCLVSEPSRTASNNGHIFHDPEIETKTFRIAGRRMWAVNHC